LFVEHVERGLRVGDAPRPITVPVIGIAHAAHALESVSAIPNVSVCAVAEEVAIEVVGQGRAALCDQLISIIISEITGCAVERLGQTVAGAVINIAI